MTGYKKVGDYIFLESIGRGAFAEVYKGMHQHTRDKVAIKMVSRSKMTEQIQQVEKEIRILKRLDHPNIVRMLSWQKTQNHYYLVFEFCKHGDFEHFIQKYYGGRVPEYDAQKYIQQIIEGIKVMKSQNIVHRDLKLANILVNKNFELKIADFGLAQHLEENNLLLKTMAGTPLNMDPCILERNSYSDKCDIWSLGVIFYQILTGKLPFHPGRGAGLEDLLKLIKKHTLVFPSDIPLSNAFKDLVRSMLVFDAEKRVSFETLFSNDWIAGRVKVDENKHDLLVHDLSANRLLKSIYDQQEVQETQENPQVSESRSEKKESKSESTKRTPLQEIDQNATCQRGVEDKVDLNLDLVSKDEQTEELVGFAFLGRIYEVFRDKVDGLREHLKSIKAILTLKEDFEDEKPEEMQGLILFAMLNLLKEVLVSKFRILDQNSGEVVFEDNFKALWAFISKNKKSIEKIYSTDDATFEVSDLYSQAEHDYIEVYEEANKRLETVKQALGKLNHENGDKILLDYLISFCENTVYTEYLEDNFEVKQEKYMTCIRICEFLLFQRDFRLMDFHVYQHIEEQADGINSEKFGNMIVQFFRRGFSFRLINEMSEQEEYKQRFKQIKKTVLVSSSKISTNTKFHSTLNSFRALLVKRIEDLRVKNES